MKKGFTMIELIFVIVILGILASVAIPRLAATREDAEISAAVANLRTLVSDATAYYTVKGSFDTNTKWSEITNVPTAKPNDNVTTSNSLKVGGENCIDFLIAGRNTNSTVNSTAQTHILFAKNPTNKDKGVCAQVLAAEPLKAYFSSTVNGINSNDGKGRVAIGSSTSIYDEQTTTSPAPAS
ncbi:MAG: type II secretion system GspH family protein [Campylobacter sp.]|uniref:type II secretion system protein n=1 Tax=Campylobacter sp. TaxID=205 RepID=UPI002AA86C12|nr:type II secretion system protein [Campylobacter sp.]MCI6344229.1 type II secretion system GspH family protein [Campylobacter sp.]